MTPPTTTSLTSLNRTRTQEGVLNAQQARQMIRQVCTVQYQGVRRALTGLPGVIPSITKQLEPCPMSQTKSGFEMTRCPSWDSMPLARGFSDQSLRSVA